MTLTLHNTKLNTLEKQLMRFENDIDEYKHLDFTQNIYFHYKLIPQ